MKNNKINKYVLWGILINAIVRITKMFVDIPDALVCFGTGLGISLILLGVYAMNNDMARIRRFKTSLIKKFVKVK